MSRKLETIIEGSRVRKDVEEAREHHPSRKKAILKH